MSPSISRVAAWPRLLLISLTVFSACAVAGPIAYVPYQDGTLAMVDTATGTLVAALPNAFGGGLPNDIALRADGGRVYVSRGTSIISLDANGNTTGFAGIPDYLPRIAVDPHNGNVYASGTGCVYSIDFAGNVNSALADFPLGMAVNPDGAASGRLYVAMGPAGVVTCTTRTSLY